MKVKYSKAESINIVLNGVDTVLTSNDLSMNSVYDVMAVENGWYRIIDNSGEDYLYPPELFEITDDSGYDELKRRDEAREWAKPRNGEQSA